MVLLVNWLWLGVLITASTAVGLRVGRRLNAATRERIWWITLGAVLLVPLIRVNPLPTWLVPAALGPILIPAATWPPHATVQPDSLQAVTPLIEIPAQPVLALAIWIGIGALAVMRLARLATSVMRVRRARAAATPFPAALEHRLQRWVAVSSACDGETPRLVLSRDVRHAAVFGCGQPLIAVSPEAAARLSADELDQVILHEYAHVRRRDPRGIFVQRIITSVFGFHPAVWWIDRALTLEREVACDDWVLAQSVTAKSYGSCLVKLAEDVARDGWSLAPGALSGSQFGRRLARLLDPLRNGSTRRSPAAVVLSTFAIAFVAVAGTGVPLAGLARPQSPLETVQTALVQPPLTAAPADPFAPAVPARDPAPAPFDNDAVPTREVEQTAEIVPIVPAERAATSSENTGAAAVLPPGLDVASLSGAGFDSPPESAPTMAAAVPGPAPATPDTDLQDPASELADRFAAIDEDAFEDEGESPVAALDLLTLSDPIAADTVDTLVDTVAGEESSRERSPWMRIADAGVRTGSFFSRFGRAVGAGF